MNYIYRLFFNIKLLLHFWVKYKLSVSFLLNNMIVRVTHSISSNSIISSALHILDHLMCLSVLWSRWWCYYSHFTNDKTEHRELSAFIQDHNRARKWWSRNFTSRSLVPEVVLLLSSYVARTDLLTPFFLGFLKFVFISKISL